MNLARPYGRNQSPPPSFREGLGEGFELGTNVGPSPSPSLKEGGGLIEKTCTHFANFVKNLTMFEVSGTDKHRFFGGIRGFSAVFFSAIEFG